MLSKIWKWECCIQVLLRGGDIYIVRLYAGVLVWEDYCYYLHKD